MTREAATIAAGDRRLEMLSRWAAAKLALAAPELAPASGDASFRRYFRLALPNGESLIAMDAPPRRENLGDFTRIARALAALGLHVPRVVAEDRERGFALVADLGRETYFARLEAGDDPAPLYSAAIRALVKLQGWRPTKLGGYDRRLLKGEAVLFERWLLARHLEIELDSAESATLEDAIERLCALALAQPRVVVHRDYHSRNLMTRPPLPGILDFQDAVRGPVTYDLVSLLKDCYVLWPPERRLAWLREYRERALAAGIPAGADEAEFIAWFDAMGMQRHLKAAGIFARLYHRDGKPNYLGDIPRTLNYVVEAAGALPGFAAFADFLAARVLPALDTASARCAR